MTTMTMKITGMTCGHCVRGVSRALEALEGVAVERVEVGTAVVNYDPAAVAPATIAKAVEEEGYQVVSTR